MAGTGPGTSPRPRNPPTSNRSLPMTRTAPDTPISRLLTIAEVAEHLRVDPKTVRRRIAGGELAAYRVGRQWRITEDQLTQFLRA